MSLKLNIGCGNDYREGYINLDFSNISSDGKSIKIDIIHNFLKAPLPFEDNSVDEVIFRETLEHISRQNSLRVLKDIYRIMSPGAKLDLTVPPALEQLKLLMMAMLSAKNPTMDDFFRAHEKGSVWKRVDDLFGGCDEETDGTDGNNHKNVFTKEMLRTILEYVGFKITSIDDRIWATAIK